MTIMTRSSKWLTIATALIVLLMQSSCSKKDQTQDESANDSMPTQQSATAATPVFKDTLPSNPAEREFDKLLKLAELGDSNAQARIAWMYRNGEGVEKNDQLAFQWMKKSAEKGDSTSQDNLGVFYRDGIGTEIDAADAVSWFKKSALQGNPQGQGNLGQALITGEGVEKNYFLAYVWTGLSAKSGKADFAKSNLVQVGGALSPEDRAKADKLIAEWKPGDEPKVP
jgi:TPR repeat protein